MPIFCHRFHSNEISRFFWWNSCHSMRNYSSFKIKSAVFPDHKCLETLRILSYCNLILRPAELNFRKSFDVIAFFAYTIAFRNNFCYFFSYFLQLSKILLPVLLLRVRYARNRFHYRKGQYLLFSGYYRMEDNKEDNGRQHKANLLTAFWQYFVHMFSSYTMR